MGALDAFLKQAGEDCVNGSSGSMGSLCRSCCPRNDDCWRCSHCEKLMRSRFHLARHEADCDGPEERD